MRGCLVVLAAGLAFLAIIAWVALPPLAGTVVAAGLLASGLGGSGTSVQVEAAPPYELLDLRADSVRVRSSDVTWRGIDATSLDITLTGVDLGARTAETVTGRLDGASVPTMEGMTPIERIDLSGPSSSIRTTLTIDPQTAANLATRAVESAIEKSTTSVRLVRPDRVRIVADSVTVEGRLSIDPKTGALVVDLSPVGHAVLTQPSSELPLVLESVAVTADGGVTLTGTLDPRALGLAP